MTIEDERQHLYKVREYNMAIEKISEGISLARDNTGKYLRAGGLEGGELYEKIGEIEDQVGELVTASSAHLSDAEACIEDHARSGATGYTLEQVRNARRHGSLGLPVRELYFTTSGEFGWPGNMDYSANERLRVLDREGKLGRPVAIRLVLRRPCTAKFGYSTTVDVGVEYDVEGNGTWSRMEDLTVGAANWGYEEV